MKHAWGQFLKWGWAETFSRGGIWPRRRDLYMLSTQHLAVKEKRIHSMYYIHMYVPMYVCIYEWKFVSTFGNRLIIFQHNYSFEWPFLNWQSMSNKIQCMHVNRCLLHTFFGKQINSTNVLKLLPTYDAANVALFRNMSVEKKLRSWSYICTYLHMCRSFRQETDNC
jgi:hypothetical protein